MGSSVRPLHAGRRGLGLPRPDPRPQVSLNTYPRKPQAVLQGRLSFNLCRLQPCLFYPDLIRHHLAILSIPPLPSIPSVSYLNPKPNANASAATNTNRPWLLVILNCFTHFSPLS